MIAEPQILDRDINDQYGEFLEQISINYIIPTYTDPYTKQPLASTTGKVLIMVSWHDVVTDKLVNDNVGQGVMGVLKAGDAYAIYQGSINLFTYQKPTTTLTRRGITYVLEATTNPSANRWVLGFKRKR